MAKGKRVELRLSDGAPKRPHAMKTPRISAAALAAFLVLSGFTRREPDAEAGIRTQTLLVGNQAEPQVASGRPEQHSTCEGLIIQNPPPDRPGTAGRNGRDIGRAHPLVRIEY